MACSGTALVLPSAPPPNGFIDSRGLNNMKVGIACSNDNSHNKMNENCDFVKAFEM
jgi:hypothetical protein